MRISEMLEAFASELESPENEALLLSEYDEECLSIVASSCVKAAEILRKAAQEVDAIEPQEPSVITPEALDELQAIVTSFDYSGDPALIRQASVLDELLQTIAAPKGYLEQKQAAEKNKIDALKSSFEEAKKRLEKDNKISEAVKEIEKSPVMQEYRPMEAPMSARTCPDHPGAQMAPVGDNSYQCELDKKIYNYAEGYKLQNGTQVPGGSVSEQTKMDYDINSAIFDSRETRSGGYRP